MTLEDRENSPWYKEWRRDFEEARQRLYELRVPETMREVAALLPKAKLEIHDDPDIANQGSSPSVELLGEENITTAYLNGETEVMTSRRSILIVDVSHITRLAEVSIWERVENSYTGKSFGGRVWDSRGEYSSRETLLPAIDKGVQGFAILDPRTHAGLAKILRP